MAYEASSAVSALEAWSAVMPASRLASCAATKASVARLICYFGVYLQWKSVHRGEQGGQRAGVRLAEEGRQRPAAILESTTEEVSTADCRA